eukprot:TRINITY_DN976_c0_g1_i1.p1 TRINITY_DN976_c0_g1~~TRINITY_DN976_c0_g1_i1.p1  ORF type:complete len:308 (-),score=67.95 TRINITY_DN976_c0_g1_i1:208-1131(-)
MSAGAVSISASSEGPHDALRMTAGTEDIIDTTSSGKGAKGQNNAAVSWIASLVASVLSINSSNSSSSSSNKKSGSIKTLFNSKKSSSSSLATPAMSPTPAPATPTTTVAVSASPLPSTSPSLMTPSIPPPMPSPDRKTLILDLDETLVHSTVKPVHVYHMTVDVTLEGVQCTFYVIKRPHVDAFLQQVAQWYNVTIFTASMHQYANPLLDQLDPSRALIQNRLFRESCLYKEGSFIKDLSLIGQDLATTIIVDNSPVAYSHNRDNALPIDNWLGDNPKDESLLNLLPFLDALRFTQDVRSILSLRIS